MFLEIFCTYGPSCPSLLSVFIFSTLKTWGGIARYGYDGNELGIPFDRSGLKHGLLPHFVLNATTLRGPVGIALHSRPGAFPRKGPPVG
jgi:hypothetical protein